MNGLTNISEEKTTKTTLFAFWDNLGMDIDVHVIDIYINEGGCQCVYRSKRLARAFWNVYTRNLAKLKCLQAGISYQLMGMYTQTKFWRAMLLGTSFQKALRVSCGVEARKVFGVH